MFVFVLTDMQVCPDHAKNIPHKHLPLKKYLRDYLNCINVFSNIYVFFFFLFQEKQDPSSTSLQLRNEIQVGNEDLNEVRK